MISFIPSMIEVPFGKYYRSCAELLFVNGFNSFHIDFGDEFLINRKLIPWEKVEFLKSLGDDLSLTAHIMCKTGSHPDSLENITEKCLKYNFETIYIHLSSFENIESFINFKEKNFEPFSNIFGIAFETSSIINSEVIQLIDESNTNKILQMGVPIGKGGQKFKKEALNVIDKILKKSKNVNIIELDGGLDLKIVKQKLNPLIKKFAGWSIISNEKPKMVLKNALALNEILKS
jgi:pentose-5-phosphate-3-epimerase